MERTFNSIDYNKNKRRILTGESILVFFSGLTATIGEKMNVYFTLASKLYFILGLLLCVLFFLRNVHRETYLTRKKRYSSIDVSLFVFFIVLTFLTILNVTSDGSSLSVFAYIDEFKTSIFILISVGLSKVFIKNEEYLEIFSWGYLVGFVLMIPFGQYGHYASGFRLVGTYSNPNTYSADCIMAFYLALYLMKNRKMRALKILFIALALLNLLRTGSRGGLLAVLVGVALLFLYTKNFKRKLTFVVCGVLVIVGVFLYLFQDSNGMMSRLFEESYSGNLRLSIWQAYFENIWRYFWIGTDDVGIASIHKYTPHNMFLGVLVRFGIFALIPYFLFIVIAVKFSFKKGRDSLSQFSERLLSCVIFSAIMSGMTMETFYHRTTWVIMAVVLFNIYDVKKTSKIQFILGR